MQGETQRKDCGFDGSDIKTYSCRRGLSLIKGEKCLFSGGHYQEIRRKSRYCHVQELDQPKYGTKINLYYTVEQN